MSRFLLAVVFLALVYALVLASADPWDLATGAAVAGTLLWGSRRFVFGERIAPVARLPLRVLAFVPFAAAVVWDITKGTWQVALVVLHVRPLAHPGVVQVPIEDRTPIGVVVSTMAMSLSPGSFLVDVDWEQRVILMHFLDASDPDAIRARQRHFYRRFQRRVFP
jgi:multisubunit Na+/H+ antiporter MnhE subunit